MTSVPEPVDGLDTVLVANRGEIARRVIRTLRRLGIRSVAVYSDADVDAPHVREADAAVRIGPAAASASYLDISAVIGAARQSGARAIHPGYGFLSENAAFARACADAGVVFIGPGEQALEVMADKIRAKAHVAAHGVPVVPGFSAAGMSDEGIAVAAASTGYPLLVKPSAGGGGKGMQIVRSTGELREALATARRVASAAFGDDTLLLERLIERPRHIEVQVLADAHGAVIHLGERECTLQRRHQKVIEEAPSPVVDAAIRARLGAAACAAAASVDYRGAGTVEFLVAADRPDEFFFIEMNTRLQVEHPVTELVTGIDLVEQQLRIAAGAPLAIAQHEVRLDGHAIEARVYAESPSRGFLPATGEVLLWRAADSPAMDHQGRVTAHQGRVTAHQGPVTEPVEVRTDAAVETGSVVSADYDPMIAKVIGWGEDRGSALARLDDALARTVLLGVESNIGFLRALLADAAVQAGDLDTGLIERLPPFGDPAPSPAALAAAATHLVMPLTPPRNNICDETSRATGSLDSDVVSRGTAHPVSPLWRTRSGWRSGSPPAPAVQRFETSDGQTVSAAPHDSSDAVVAGPDADGRLWVHVDGETVTLRPLSRRQAMERRLARADRTAVATDPQLRSPMPGAIVAVHVVDGAAVAKGQRIVTIEAMKMEHAVVAPHDGVVTLKVNVGAQVRRDQALAHVTPQPHSDPDPDPDSIPPRPTRTPWIPTT